MKIYIGPYKKWWGPYQIAELIPFISKNTREKIGDWLNKTWLNEVCEWIYDKNERTVKVRIDPYDTWSMDHTLAHIILPMLKQLKTTKQGSQWVDDEDIPPHMRHTLSKGPDDWKTDDRWVHYKWEWVLNEIIWAFEKVLDENWEDQFSHGVPDIQWNLVSGKEGDENAMYEMKQINRTWIDYNGIKEYNNRIDNGFRLFGKYYRGLWE